MNLIDSQNTSWHDRRYKAVQLKKICSLGGSSSMRKLTLIFFCCLVLPMLCRADNLSKQKILDLQKSGVNESILIRTIQKEGISFDPTSDVILELKKSGVSNAVVSAILEASAKMSKPDSDPISDIKLLYSQGKYVQLGVQLRSILANNPADYRMRTFLIMTLLRMHDQSGAAAQIDILKNSQQSEADPYIKQIDSLAARLAAQEKSKQDIQAALRDLNAEKAITLIDKLSASETQKGILRFYIALYRGKFDEARTIASQIQIQSFAEQERLDGLKTQIGETESIFGKLMSGIDLYLYSPLAPSYCAVKIPKETPEMSRLSIKEYIDIVSKLSQLTPLNDHVMDLGFHAELLLGNYAELQNVGDRILSAKGAIAIPFYSRDRFFRLVVDSRNKKIFTEADPHPFLVRYAIGSGYFIAVHHDQDHNDYLSDLVPFNLGFEEIRGISQNGHGRSDESGTILSGKSYALKFEPTGLAPNYGLMHYMNCFAGEAAQKTATRNLGQYILHIIQNTNVKANLENPGKVSHFWDYFSATALALQGAAGPPSGIAASNAEALSSQLQRQRVIEQNQSGTWNALISREALNFDEAFLFEGLEKLVGVL